MNMTYLVDVSNIQGERIAMLGPFGNVASARQAMLDHSNTVALPTEEPFYVPSLRVLEGWFVGQNEYCILAR
jgi:hypothetical protein